MPLTSFNGCFLVSGLTRKTASAVFWTLGSQASVAVVSLASFTVLSRHVDVTAFGEYLLALVVLSAIQWCANGAYREPVIQAPEMDEGVASSVFWFTVAVGALLALVAAGTALVLIRLDHELVGRCVLWMLPRLFIDTTNSVPQALAYRAMSFRMMAVQNAAGTVLGSALAILLILQGLGVEGVAVAQNVAPVVTLIVLMGGRRGWRPRWRFARADLAVLRRYTPHVLMWQFVEMLNGQLDRFLVGARLSPGALGVYGFARRLNEVVIGMLVGAASNVALPVFSSLQREPERLRPAFLKAVRLVSFGIFPVIATLFALADTFVPWVFGDKWSQAVFVYRCFLLLGLIQTIGILQASVIRGLGHAALWSRYQVVQSGANVVVCLVAVPWGIHVLAIAVVVRTYVLWGYAVRMTCKVVGLRPRAYLHSMAPSLACSVVAGAAGTGVQHLTSGMPPPVSLAVSCAVVGLVYLLQSWWFQRDTLREGARLVWRGRGEVGR